MASEIGSKMERKGNPHHSCLHILKDGNVCGASMPVYNSECPNAANHASPEKIFNPTKAKKEAQQEVDTHVYGKPSKKDTQD